MSAFNWSFYWTNLIIVYSSLTYKKQFIENFEFLCLQITLMTVLSIGYIKVESTVQYQAKRNSLKHCNFCTFLLHKVCHIVWTILMKISLKIREIGCFIELRVMSRIKTIRKLSKIFKIFNISLHKWDRYIGIRKKKYLFKQNFLLWNDLGLIFTMTSACSTYIILMRKFLIPFLQVWNVWESCQFGWTVWPTAGGLFLQLHM